ncbi:recombinase family protein [Baaleninema sp.]|uniref:recombinase family protein n=1 Tax=Baaleninema sp. TaxID=3101197 RepID=UPI003D02E614
MPFESVWVVGASRSGKTTALVSHLSQRLNPDAKSQKTLPQPTALVLAANGDNRMALSDRIVVATSGRSPVYVTTPLGFFENEVVLFWPLLVRKLNLQGQFPLRLRPETEQALATELWSPELESGQLQQPGLRRDRLVRRTLDFLQLAGAAGIPLEKISQRLERGLSDEESSPELWQLQEKLLLRWRQWCLSRGLLTYGLIFDLYWRHLLPLPEYQQHLKQRFAGVFADDVDEYPALARLLFETLLDLEIPGTFTFNPEGGIRQGLNADPEYMAQLSQRCRVESVSGRKGLAATWGDAIVKLALDPTYWTQLPGATIHSVQTRSRAQLLRQVAERIAEAVASGTVKPEDVVIIVPGLDAIARYTLTQILSARGVPVRSLNMQRPLVTSPGVRAVLTLLALLYPGLGRTIDRNAVAEMLVVFSASKQSEPGDSAIDPVRAGTLCDICYVRDPQRPHLLPAETFERWDRLGYRAKDAYERIRTWIDTHKIQEEQLRSNVPVVAIDTIVREFLWRPQLSEDRLEALRELLETAQHFWEVETRIRGRKYNVVASVSDFVQLLRRGTVSANPYPLRDLARPAVLLSNIYQYRSSRLHHRWHVWLDIGSPLWLQRGAASLFGASLFLQSRPPFPQTEEEIQNSDFERLECILYDLLARVEERVILGHSDLAVSGQEQTGLLLALANATSEGVMG